MIMSIIIVNPNSSDTIMRSFLFALVVVGLIGCSSPTESENGTDKVKYVVEDLSETPAQKKIEFKIHSNAPMVVVQSTKDHWERSVDIDKNIDLKLKATVVSSDLIPMKISIYINDELRERKEFETVHSLTVNHVR